MESHGIPTETCMPYRSQNGCPYTAECPGGCTADVYKATNLKSFANDVDGAMCEIMANGPIQTIMVVYNDFLSYTGGIYHHRSGGFYGLHSVKIVGWGQ